MPSIDSTYNEAELLLRLATGDEAAFAAVYRHYYSYMFPFLIRFTGSATDAEEVIQETFMRVWLSRDQLQDVLNFKSWLFTIASRQHLQRLRKELRLKEKADRYAAQDTSEAGIDTPDITFELEEIKTTIREAVSKLSEQRKKIYLLSREKGYSPTEIAKLLDLTPQTVHNTLSAALKHIREHLERSGHHFPLLVCLLLKIF